MTRTQVRLFDLMIVASLAVPVAPCAAQSAAAPPGAVPESCTGNYVIGPDDVLDVSVWGNADVTRTVPVRPDGRISLPLVNDIQAAGLTPMQLGDAVTKALTPYIPEPAVAVLVREVRSFKVTVIGQVKTPGRYELKDRATVLDVLAMAGGLNEYAAPERIAVLRQEAGSSRQIPFRYDRLTAMRPPAKRAAENFCVKPGDVILVP
ncbi:MAG TPA: polysaccharide biosynthesis/export family protein [Vicinamibacterales bacterium]|nr:polysaccharide biosynthesis/export family protein [Vicinamibacterales bacterium]